MPRPFPAAYLTRPRWTTHDARAALSALNASKLSVAAFATREGLDPQRLYCWRRRLSAENVAAEPAPEFVELRPRERERVEVVLCSGRVLRMAEDISAAALERLVAVLERASPC